MHEDDIDVSVRTVAFTRERKASITINSRYFA